MVLESLLQNIIHKRKEYQLRFRPSLLQILLKVFIQKRTFLTFVNVSRPLPVFETCTVLQLAAGEKQKSIEKPVINSFTVIKTLESLKGVRLLMSCDILESPRTLNCNVPAQEVFTAGRGRREREGKKEQDGTLSLPYQGRERRK